MALLAMSGADQQMRSQVDDHTDSEGTVEPEFLQRWQDLDRKHTAALRQIVVEYGWPGHAIAGVDGADAAWLLAQHAELTDQLVFWPLLQDAVANGDATVMQLAFLEDRIALRQGRPQYYGTQMIRHTTGPFRLHDTAEMDTLDQRRAAIGLGPVAAQIAHINASHRSATGEEDQ